jgi:hypothetical protein
LLTSKPDEDRDDAIIDSEQTRHDDVVFLSVDVADQSDENTGQKDQQGEEEKELPKISGRVGKISEFVVRKGIKLMRKIKNTSSQDIVVVVAAAIVL